MSSPACSVFNSRSLATASNSGDSSVSCAQVISSQSPVQNSTGLTNPELDCQFSTDYRQLITELVALILFSITPRHGPRRKHPASPVTWVTVAAGKCLLSRCPEAGII
jgi:hypothetical protein